MMEEMIEYNCYIRSIEIVSQREDSPQLDKGYHSLRQITLLFYQQQYDFFYQFSKYYNPIKKTIVFLIWEKLNFLKECRDKILSKIIVMEEYERREKRREVSKYIIGSVIGIIIAVMAGYIIHLLTK